MVIEDSKGIENEPTEITHNIEGYEVSKNIYEHPTVNRLRKIYKEIGEFISEESFDVFKGSELISSKVSWKDV